VIVGAAAAIVFALMLVENGVSARHDRALRASGAVEPDGDVYRLMAVAYPGAFVAMLLEGFLRDAGSDRFLAAGAALFVAAKALKYWAIASLGTRWTFRVLVPPGSARTIAGPYRWLSHPNYVAVVGELAGTAIAMHAVVSGPVAVIGFGLLIVQRIRVEEMALAGR
jgi:methyltransferase